MSSVTYHHVFPSFGPSATTGTPRSVTYNLDAMGNRNSVVDENGNATAYTSNSLNQYTMAQGQPVANGPNHELSDHAGKSYTYIHDEHLQSVSTANDFYWLGYDALGRCVIRSLNSSTVAYVYDGARAIGE